MPKSTTLDDLKRLMTLVDFSAEFIRAKEWTPASVAPILLTKLAESNKARWSKELTIADACDKQYLDTSRSTLNRWLNDGHPGYEFRCGGTRVQYRIRSN